MLGVYTNQFGDCRDLLRLFANGGFDVRYERFFWGCASGVVGKKV
jgi:demethylmenaquinone methyltransferase/2-methoxy-6-polyprenyl-1,4-benzoquinol methylase